MDFDSYTNNFLYSTGDKNTEDAVRKAYRAESARLAEKFKNDLFKDLGVENHPKREKLYELALYHGDGNGLEFVYRTACDLVELMDL